MRKLKTIQQIKKIEFSSMQLVALGFLGVILLGGVLLWLPVSNQQPIHFLDALFTSVTCVCVTGLITIVPGSQFTFFGKVVLTLLIQIGGMGIIACMVLFFLILRKKITMKERIRIQEAYGLDTLSGLVSFMIRIMKGIAIVEGIGALLYAIWFIPRYGLVTGIGYGIFHSVSAFCNAGIDLMGSNSLLDYANSPFLLLVTMWLIVMGGLGFPVWFDIRETLQEVRKKNWPKKRYFTRLQLHTRIVLVMTAILIFGGAIMFFLLEHKNPETMGGMALWEKWMAALFQSVTARTAGFAGIPQNSLKESSQLFCCILMFIGGSPAGTAGGIKTTTMAVLILTCIATIRGQKDTECMGYRIDPEVIRSGLSIIMISLAVLFGGLTILTVLEPDVSLQRLTYEAMSAFATVGLSDDLTPHLTHAAKIVIMVLMYIGRIGPVTMALLFGGKVAAGKNLRDLPEKKILVG